MTRPTVSLPRVSGLLAAIFVLLLVSGCVISPRRPATGGSSSPTPTPTNTGKVYVANDSANAIVRFDNAFTANGAVTASAVVKGANTGLSSPQYMFLDVAADQLYVANSGGSSVLVFSGASTMTGNATPARTITSAGLTAPSDVALDKGRNLLYVLDAGDIFTFNNASTANGASIPTQDIVLAFAGQAIFVDAPNNRLFVADPAGNQIAVFDNASTLNGAVTASRTISGANTQLNVPSGLLVDSSGRLVVSNAGATPSITIYTNAATANLNISPVDTIKGTGTTLSAPNQMALNTVPASTELFVADPTTGEVAVFGSFANASGNVAPTRTITGTGVTQSTAAPTARGIALDTTR